MARTRIGGTRNATSRNATRRAEPKTHYQSALHIPRDKWKKGMEYAWVRMSTLNEPDPANVAKRWRAGWRPVPADRHPEYHLPDIPGMPRREDNTIVNEGGLMLCEKEAYLVEEEREAMRQENMDAIEGIRWTGQDVFDRNMPRFDDSSEVGVERVVAQPKGPTFKD